MSGRPPQPGRTLHDQVADEIGARIVGGDYKPGSLLPTEQELCVHLSVSRPVLREAFRLLTAKGLIASRRKLGTKVRPRAEWNMLDPALLSWQLRRAPTPDFVAALFELRGIVEPQAAALAAERADPAALARMAAALEAMQQRRADPLALIGADLGFHRAILDGTGNVFLACFGALIETALDGSFRLSWQVAPEASRDAMELHREVFEAVRDGRAEAARGRMRALLHVAAEDAGRALAREAAAAAED